MLRLPLACTLSKLKTALKHAATLRLLSSLVGRVAARSAPQGDPATLDDRVDQIRGEVNALDELLNGNPARRAINERTQPTVRSRLGRAMGNLYGSTYGPTQTQREQLAYAKADFNTVRNRLDALTRSTIPAFEAELLAKGAPYVPGGVLPEAQ